MEETPQHRPSAIEWEDHYRNQPMGWRGVSDIDLPPCEGQRILELGCGNGKTLEQLVASGAEVHAIDFSPSAVEICMKRFGDDADIMVADVRDLPFPDSFFDGILAVHVLNHLIGHDRDMAAKEIRRCISPGGWLFQRGFDRCDMRYGQGREVEPHSFLRGNGIMYHYQDPEEMMALFSDASLVRSLQGKEEKRYHGRRMYRSWSDMLLVFND